jgi:hypothetical protein
MCSVRPLETLPGKRQRRRLPSQNWGAPLPASLASTGAPGSPDREGIGPVPWYTKVLGDWPRPETRMTGPHCPQTMQILQMLCRPLPQHAQSLVDLIGGVKKGDLEVSETIPLVLTPAKKESSAYMRNTPFGHPFWHPPHSAQTNLSL